MRSPPGSVSPTATIWVSPVASASRIATDVEPLSMDAAKATAPVDPTAGQRPKWAIVPPPGAGSPSREIARVRPLSTTKIAASTGANLSMPWKAMTPASLSPMRSENLAKMPPIGVSSPAATTIWMRSPVATKTPPGTALPSTTAAKATCPPALTASAPHGGEEDHVAARIDGRGVDTGEHARWHARRGAPGRGDRAQASGGPGEDALDGAPTRHRGRERDRARVVQGRRRMLAEAREPADSRHPVALARHRHEAAGALEEDPFVRAAPGEGREERDVAPRIDRRDDRQRFLAESVEAAAARHRVARTGERAEHVRLAGVRHGGRARRERGEQEQADERRAGRIRQEYRKIGEGPQ